MDSGHDEASATMEEDAPMSMDPALAAFCAFGCAVLVVAVIAVVADWVVDP
jgi:uncharacterized protein YutD